MLPMDLPKASNPTELKVRKLLSAPEPSEPKRRPCCGLDIYTAGVAWKIHRAEGREVVGEWVCAHCYEKEGC